MSKSIYNERFENKLKHLFDASPWNVYNADFINLSVGAPGTDLLERCCPMFEKATKHRMKYDLENNSISFQYGPTLGGYDYRKSISEFLTKNYNEKVHSEDIILSSGATNGLHLIMSTLIDFSGIVFVDEVTYMIALDIFALFPSIRVVTVPLTKDGTDIEALRKLIEEHKFTPKDGKLFWGIYYTIPTFHNPTGLLFTEDVCKNLIKLSREFDLLIACDDVYNLLHYCSDSSPKRLFSYDNFEDPDFKGNVISNGSFSKILSPGIRIGWMECPPRCIAAFNNCGVLQSGGAVNHYTSGIITSLIDLGLAQEQLDYYSMKYKERMFSLIEILDEKLPKNCSYIKPRGGYFVWITLPVIVNSIDFIKFCIENYKIVFIEGNRFSKKNLFKNNVRITFAFHEADIIREALEKFCEAIQVYTNLK